MKLSVIVPVYNIEHYVSYCIESIICQNNIDMEVILVDDGSTDNSSMICDAFAEKFSNIIVIHKQNGGLSSARNAGLDIANGDYVLFIDGDDYLQNGAIKELVKVAEKTSVDVVQFGYEEVFGYDQYTEAIERLIKNKSEVVVETDRYKFYDNLYRLGGVAASACTKLMCLDLVKLLRFKEGLLHEDEQFTSHLLANCKSIAYVNDFLPYKYVMREGSIIHENFSEKKLYDLSFIYEERIEILQDLNYTDLVNRTASKYFDVLIFLYGQALKVDNKRALHFIQDKLRYLLSNYPLRPLGYNRYILALYRLGLSGVGIYYGIRKIFGK